MFAPLDVQHERQYQAAHAEKLVDINLKAFELGRKERVSYLKKSTGHGGRKLDKAYVRRGHRHEEKFGAENVLTYRSATP